MAGFLCTPTAMIVGNVTSLVQIFTPSPLIQGSVFARRTRFSSGQIFGIATMSGRLQFSVVPTKHFTSHSAGVARCQMSDQNSISLDTWLGRAAMLGFVSVVAIETATGKGVLEMAGLETPLPTWALGFMAAVGVVTAFKIFRSADDS